MSVLPKSWTRPTIGSLCELINGRAFKPTDWTAEGLPIVRIQNLNDQSAPFNRFDGEVRGRFLIDSGVLLFAWSGTPGTSFGAHIWNRGPAILNQHIFNIVFDETKIDKEFFRLAINQKLDELIDKAHGGVGLRHVTKGKVESTEIDLPPLHEQRRIVAKIERLFRNSAASRTELARVPRLIERYKRAVLAAAFRGDLTTAWRHEHVGDAGSFLKALGIAPLQHNDLPQLPHSWCWVTAGALCAIKSGIALGKNRKPGTLLIERPYLRVANVQRGWLNLSEIKTTSVTETEAKALYLQPGDVLMNEGGDRDKLGRGWVWNGEVPECIHQNHVFRLRPRSPLIPSRYISYYANEFGQNYFLREGKQTTNLASISMSKISSLPIPVAPPDEMALIVSSIEYAFAHIDRIAAESSRATKLLNRLEQATLAKAFRGELLSYDVTASKPDTIESRDAGEPRRRNNRRRGAGAVGESV